MIRITQIGENFRLFFLRFCFLPKCIGKHLPNPFHLPLHGDPVFTLKVEIECSYSNIALPIFYLPGFIQFVVIPNLVDFNFMILGNGKFEIGFLGCPNSAGLEYSHSKFNKLPLLGCYAHQLFDKIPKNCWLFHLRAFFYPLGDLFYSPPSFYAFWILGGRNGGQRTFLPWREGVGEEKPMDLIAVGVRRVHRFDLEE